MTQPQADTPRKILIRTPNWLGDLMMSTAFIRAVLQRYPNTEVDLIVKQGFETLPLPQRGKILPYDKRKTDYSTFIQTLKNQQYQRVYILPPSFSSAWMCFRAGIPERVGYAGEFRSWLLKPAARFNQPARTIHLVQEYLNLLEPPIAMDQVSCGLEIDQDWIARQLAEVALPAADYVVLAHGAIYGPAKQWPVSHFARLAEQLVDRGINVVVVGTPQDQQAGAVICGGMAGATNLCGQTSLLQLVAVLAKAALVVSNDSGAMHVAAALGVAQVALFGSTSPVWTGPLNHQAKVITLNLDCSPCFGRTCKFGHTNCLQQITPAEVMKRVFDTSLKK